MLIGLTRNKSAIIDDEDFDLVMSVNRKWAAVCTHGVWYAQAYRDYTQVLMHRIIMGEPEDQVHHVNGDGLDNRRSNLALCSAREHSYTKKWPNKSGFRGVCYEGRPSGPWVAHIRIPGTKGIYKIGRFKTAEEAAHAYDEFARKYHGNFATLNFK